MRVSSVLGYGRAARDRTQRTIVARVLLLLSVLLFSPFCQCAQDGSLPAYQIKSAFLYNFAKFIQWPPRAFASADAPLVIGVIGRNPFGDYLKELNGRTIGTHQIQIQQFDDATDAASANCHVLFIADRKRAGKIVTELRNADVLTITDEVDTDSFQSMGAVINLVTTANRTVHFEINVDAARRAELKINSSLLNLAKIVRDGRA